ncbi:MAG: hypothetical protein RIC55_26580 [Pirellulaceae bacterium]
MSNSATSRFRKRNDADRRLAVTDRLFDACLVAELHASHQRRVKGLNELLTGHSLFIVQANGQGHIVESGKDIREFF